MSSRVQGITCDEGSLIIVIKFLNQLDKIFFYKLIILLDLKDIFGVFTGH